MFYFSRSLASKDVLYIGIVLNQWTWRPWQKSFLSVYLKVLWSYLQGKLYEMPEDRRAKKEKKETVELRCLFLKNKTHGTVTTKQNRRKTLFIESLHNLLIILKLLWSYLLKRSCKNYPVCRHLQKTERVPDLFPTEWRNKKFLLKKKKNRFSQIQSKVSFWLLLS